MSFEEPRRRELSKLVADHILGNEYRDVTFAVVNSERESDHIRRDRRATRPGLDRRRLGRSVHDPFENFLDAQIDKRSFFK